MGIGLGAYFGQIPAPLPKILFTFVATAFGVALILSRWGFKWSPRNDIAQWNTNKRLLFVFIGLFGGAFAANTGSGTDMLAFMVMTLAFGINEKISVPTTVIIMVINSVVGFLVYAMMPGMIAPAWDYWLAAIPIVILGAPLGAFAAAIIKRDHLIKFILGLISLELGTTLWLVPFNDVALKVTFASIGICAISFMAMLYHRHQLGLSSDSSKI